MTFTSQLISDHTTKMAQEVANEIMDDLHCSQNCCGVTFFECHFVSPNVS